MDDRQIDYWAEQYHKRGLQKYISFELYLKLPHLINQVWDELDHRPLLPEQAAVTDDIPAFLREQAD